MRAGASRSPKIASMARPAQSGNGLLHFGSTHAMNARASTSASNRSAAASISECSRPWVCFAFVNQRSRFWRAARGCGFLAICEPLTPAVRSVASRGAALFTSFCVRNKIATSCGRRGPESSAPAGQVRRRVGQQGARGDAAVQRRTGRENGGALKCSTQCAIVSRLHGRALLQQAAAGGRQYVVVGYSARSHGGSVLLAARAAVEVIRSAVRLGHWVVPSRLTAQLRVNCVRS